MLYQVSMIYILAGYIDGDRHYLISLIHPLPELFTGLLPDINIQLTDKTVLFKNGNKNTRRNKSSFRMPPAN